MGKGTADQGSDALRLDSRTFCAKTLACSAESNSHGVNTVFVYNIQTTGPASSLWAASAAEARRKESPEQERRRQAGRVVCPQSQGATTPGLVE